MKRSFSKTITLTGTTPKELLDSHFESVTLKVTGAGTVKVNGGAPITLATGATITFQSADPITSVVATPAASSGFSSILLTGLCDNLVGGAAEVIAVENPFKVKDPVVMPVIVYDTSDGSALVMTCETAGAEIYYAAKKNGTYTKYTTSVEIAKTSAVQTLTYFAYAKKEGLRDSAITEYTFEVAAAAEGDPV